MNWFGKTIQGYAGKKDAVLDLGCGMMGHILDTLPTHEKSRLKCKYPIVGVDIFKPYLDYLNKRGDVIGIIWDLRSTPLPFVDKSFDIVILSDVLEHLDSIVQSEALLSDSERIARNVVIGLTPNIFSPSLDGDTIFPYDRFSSKDNKSSRNVFQAHHILVNPEWLREKGYCIVTPKEDNSRHTFFLKKLDPKNKKRWKQ